MNAQHNFSQEELVVLMIKAANAHEGHYVLMFDVNIAMGGFTAPAHPTTARSGMMITFDNFTIQQVPEDTPDSIDASVVNPAPETKTPD